MVSSLQSKQTAARFLDDVPKREYLLTTYACFGVLCIAAIIGLSGSVDSQEAMREIMCFAAVTSMAVFAWKYAVTAYETMGKTADAMEQTAKQKALEKHVERMLATQRSEFNIELNRNDDQDGVKVGLLLKPTREKRGGILVRGIVPDELMHLAGADVVVGDRLISVNDQAETGLMMQELSKLTAKKVSLRFSRETEPAAPVKPEATKVVPCESHPFKTMPNVEQPSVASVAEEQPEIPESKYDQLDALRATRVTSFVNMKTSMPKKKAAPAIAATGFGGSQDWLSWLEADEAPSQAQAQNDKDADSFPGLLPQVDSVPSQSLSQLGGSGNATRAKAKDMSLQGLANCFTKKPSKSVELNRLKNPTSKPQEVPAKLEVYRAAPGLATPPWRTAAPVKAPPAAAVAAKAAAEASLVKPLPVGLVGNILPVKKTSSPSDDGVAPAHRPRRW